MADVRPSLDPAFAAFGVDVAIPYPAGDVAPLAVRAIPLPYRPAEVPMGTALRDPQYRMVYAFRRADLETLPRGTLLEAPEIAGGTVVTWKVDSAELVNAEEFRVVVVRT